MSDSLSPALQRRTLGRELRRIREMKGKTIDTVARDLNKAFSTGFSAAKISRLETGKRGANPRDVRDLCDYYEVEAAERDRLVDLAKAAREDNQLQGVPESYVDFMVLEAQARVVRTYEPAVVPGLLQTVDYDRARFDGYAPSGLDPDSSTDSSRKRIELRMERQRRLTAPDNPLIYKAVVDESVLRRSVGSPEVMAAQLAHLVDMSNRPNITLRVVTFSRGFYPGCESAGFTLLEIDLDEPSPEDNVCFLEGFGGSVWAEKLADRRRLAQTFEYLETIALSPEQSRDFILEAARAFA